MTRNTDTGDDDASADNTQSSTVETREQREVFAEYLETVRGIQRMAGPGEPQDIPPEVEMALFDLVEGQGIEVTVRQVDGDAVEQSGVSAERHGESMSVRLTPDDAATYTNQLREFAEQTL